MKRVIKASVVVVLCLSLWQLVCLYEWIPSLLLPSPLAILKWFYIAIIDGTLLNATLITLKRLIAGYIPGLVLGLLFGIIIYRFTLAQDTLGLVALGLQTLPSVCWTPFALLWFGHTERALFFVVIMGSVWSMMMATNNALLKVPKEWINVAKVLGVQQNDLYFKVMFPAALPNLVTGARLGWAFAWRSLMAAEIYVTVLDYFGLGQLLHFGRELQAMDQAMGVMLTIIVLGILADKGLFFPLEQYIHQKWGF